MLKLSSAPTFKAKVGIPLAGGKTAEIFVEFRHMARSELLAFLGADESRWRRLVNQIMRRPEKTDAERLSEIMVGWSGVDEEYSQAALEKLCEMYPHAPSLIVEAWARGLAEGRLGN